MARDKIYFLSDLHLGAPYLPESKVSERRIVAFLEHIRHDAAEIYLLGDILDYWFEYRYVVPRGFVRFFGKLAELSDSGVKITWVIGNHDIWIFDYLPNELGIEVIDGVVRRELLGKKFFMAHGDGLGQAPWKFRLIRNTFRNRFAQKLFSGIHPRWTVPFAYAWSAQSRKKGEDEKPGLRTNPTDRSSSPFVKPIEDYSLEVLAKEPSINYFVYGHIHVAICEQLSPTCQMFILGEWIRTFSFAVFDGEQMTLHRWADNQIVPLK